MTPTPKMNLKEQIYTSIMRDISCGAYKPGDVLRERTLVEKYAVSKSPVREALIELCNENILRSIPRYGYEVVSLTQQDIQNIQEFRHMLECGCLAQYWDDLTPEQIRKLEMLTYTLPENQEIGVRLQWENNAAFHLALVSCCKNRFIYDSLQKAIATQIRAFAQFYWDKWLKTPDLRDSLCHKQIVECIHTRDKDRALKLLSDDIRLM